MDKKEFFNIDEHKCIQIEEIIKGIYPKFKEELKKHISIQENPLHIDAYKYFCHSHGINFNDILKLYETNELFIGVEDVLEVFIEKYSAKICCGFYIIKRALRKFCDLREEYYSIVALWIVGTYFHKYFITYPYLFFNAMKGSGKSRTLKLVCHLSKDGELMVSLKEAVLFRTAEFGSTIGIDEAESISSKEKQALRELLNSAYKKGTKVKRLQKIKVENKEKYVVEEFKPYCPIAMANIRGLEDVLGDRCLTLVLDKSNNPKITKLRESFDIDPDCVEIKELFNELSVISERKIKKNLTHIDSVWNIYIYNNTYTTTLNTLSSISAVRSFNNIKRLTNTFKKINESGIDSRSNELSFPLLILAFLCNKEEVFNEILSALKKMVAEKEKEDVAESWDIGLLECLASQENSKDFIGVSAITRWVRDFFGEEAVDSKGRNWVTPKWTGRALKRLGLVIDRRRMPRGIEVRIDFKKVLEKIKIIKPEFKPPEKQSELPKETEVEEISDKPKTIQTPDGIDNCYKKPENNHILMPCKYCGEAHSKGWKQESAVDGKAVCDICAGTVEK